MNKNIQTRESSEMSYTTVINRIYYLMNLRGWSIKTLSERSNIPYDTLKKLLNKKIASTSMNNILRIASAFHCRVDFLLEPEPYATAEKDLSLHSRSVVHYVKEMENSISRCYSHCRDDYIPVYTPLPLYPKEMESCFNTELLEISRYRPRYSDSLEYGIRIIGNCYHPVFYEGDILLIGRNRTPHNGETGVFVHSGYLYIRKFFSHLDRVLLEPVNGIGPDMILQNLVGWTILGYVLDVYRGLSHKPLLPS